MQQALALEPEHPLIGRPVEREAGGRRLRPATHALGRHGAAVAKAQHQLVHVTREPPAGHGELQVARRRHGAAGVHEPGEQRPALGLGTPQVRGRHVLVTEKADGGQHPLRCPVVRSALPHDHQALSLEVHDDLRVGRGDPRIGGVAVAQPDPQRVRRQLQLRLGQLQRGRDANGVVGTAVSGLAARRSRDLRGGADLLRAAARPARGARVGQPLVLGVGDHARAVGEDDLVARASGHDLRRADDARGTAVGVEQQVARGNLAHRRPAGRRGQGRVECERLPETRTAGDDDELAGVQAVGQAVEVGEPGRHTGHRAAAAADGLELVHRRLHELLEQRVVLAAAALGHVVDGLLGPVDDVVDAAGTGCAVAELHDPRARLDQAAQDRLLGDDPRVEAGVGRCRHRRQQRVQIGGSADAADLAEPGQLRGDGDRVGRLALAVEVDDHVEDRLVGGLVEVGRPHDLDDVGDRVLGQQHAAQHRLLGGDVLRRSALELRGGAGRLRRQLHDPL